MGIDSVIDERQWRQAGPTFRFQHLNIKALFREIKHCKDMPRAQNVVLLEGELI